MHRTLSGKQIIAGEAVNGALSGTNETVAAVNPATGESLEPTWAGASDVQIRKSCSLAREAFVTYRTTSLEERAVFLEAIATQILALGDELIERAVLETGLPGVRIEGERGRTVNQLKLFANVVRAGRWLDARIDPAQPSREPLPRPDVRYRKIPLGPVAIFGASNFPLAFSVAGGDTASALAAGAPVVVKAHPAHPGTSELVGHAINQAVTQCGLPGGVFSLLFGAGNELGATLVRDPDIMVAGFTGSRAGGTALMKLAAYRPVPIPVYAEMSSINPVFMLPGALSARTDALAKEFVTSLTMGAGQFCTSPGIVLALAGPELDQFLQACTQHLAQSEPQTMLTSGIHGAYERGVTRIADVPGVSVVGSGISQANTAASKHGCQAHIYSVTADIYRQRPELAEEVFGACSLIIQCQTPAQMMSFITDMEGQLTATLHMEPSDVAFARQLLPELETRVGRILCNGFPTGVEVCHAMVHGGPFPSTSDGRTTSVGTAAIDRFLRPVCYQDLPDELLPASLKVGNPSKIPRLEDGRLV